MSVSLGLYVNHLNVVLTSDFNNLALALEDLMQGHWSVVKSN
jgi:hypothetical protein